MAQTARVGSVVSRCTNPIRVGNEGAGIEKVPKVSFKVERGAITAKVIFQPLSRVE